MSFTKWFKGSGSGRNDQDNNTTTTILKRSKTKTKKRSEEDDYYTQDDMEDYVYDNNYHYQPAPGLQPTGYGYSQRMAAKPKKPRLAEQEGHFDAEELTRRLLNVLAEQKAHEVKRQRIREARAAVAAQDPGTQWQQRQEAAISSLNRVPSTAVAGAGGQRTTGLRKPSKSMSYADADIEAAACAVAEEHEYRHVPINAARALQRTATNRAIRDQERRQAGQHRRRSSELAGGVLTAERTRALPHQIQPATVEVPSMNQARGQESTDKKAKRRHSLSLEGALSRISAALGASGHGTEPNQQTTTAPVPVPAQTSATTGQQQQPELMESNETENQPAAAAAAAVAAPQPAAGNDNNNNENDDLSALPSPRTTAHQTQTQTQTQAQSLSQRFKKSPSLLNLRQKLGMNGSSSSGSSPGSPATANSSNGSSMEVTSPLTAASSCGTAGGGGGAGVDNHQGQVQAPQQPQPQPQRQLGSVQQQKSGGTGKKSQEKEEETTTRKKMNSKKSGFFAKLVGGSVKKKDML